MGKNLIAACEQLGLSIVASDPIAREETKDGNRYSYLEFHVELKCDNRRQYRGNPVRYTMGITPMPRKGQRDYDARMSAHERDVKERRPTLDGVIEALVLDADCWTGAVDFEDFCSSMGYSDDSRKAEAIYNACGETSKRLAAMLGEEGLKLLRDAIAADNE